MRTDSLRTARPFERIGHSSEEPQERRVEQSEEKPAQHLRFLLLFVFRATCEPSQAAVEG